MSEATFSRLRGLIIGIDNYSNSRHRPLLGCVNDATSVLGYFTKDLGVPSSHFKCLFNEEATRDNIINTFTSHLIKNPDIERFDPILIYYAGHGDVCPALVEWGSGGDTEDIETLVPYDADTLDAQGEYIFGIPDRTLGALIYHLSQTKGNNITVILDSCHSGSGTRGDDALVRSSHIQTAPPIPRGLDESRIQELLPEKPIQAQVAPSRGSSRRLLAPSLETHTLLAACRNDEQAQEVEGQGVFTYALLRSFREYDLSTTSYSTLLRSVLDIVTRVKLPGPQGRGARYRRQTPQCEGRNQDRLIFSTHLSVSKGKIALMRTTSPGIFRIKAGNAVGIVQGTEFGAFSDSAGSTSTSAPIAQLVATDVGPTGAFLKELNVDPNSPIELPVDTYVTVIKYNDHPNAVRVAISEKEKSTLPSPWPEVFRNVESLPIVWTKPEEPSDLVLVPKDNGLEIQRNTHSLEKPGPTHIHLKHSPEANRLFNILAAIIHFHFHLQRQNPEAPLQAHLGMKLQELKEVRLGRWGIPEYEPKGEDIFAECFASGTVTSVQANTDKLFGLTLTNDSDQSLFPYVLYYNLEDYSVSCLYDPPSRSMKAPLPAAAGGVPGSLSIGYGTGGSDAFNVELTNPESKMEYGIFVLLAFSEWVDVAYLQQESPFEIKNNGARSSIERRVPKSGVWDKISVRVSIHP